MKDSKYIMGVITGAAIAFGLCVFAFVNEPRALHADDEAASAGHITAVTANYNVGQEVLYLIDSQQETIMAYMVNGPASGVNNRADYRKLQLLAVRSYKWDKKLEEVGTSVSNGTSVKQIKMQVLKAEEAEN
jgi:hypothetical protein